MRVRDTFTNIRKNKRKVMDILNTVITVGMVTCTVGIVLVLVGSLIKLIVEQI